MKDSRDAAKRNSKMNDMVNLASQGDVKSYIEFLIDNHKDVTDNSILSDEDYKHHLAKLLSKNPLGITLTVEESARLLLCKNNLTEREYKSLKQALAEKKVKIQPYDLVSQHIKSLDIGVLCRTCSCQNECMSSVSHLHETLNFVINNKFWLEKMEFICMEQTEKLFKSLQKISSSLYGGFNVNNKTLFIRMTGDNFRAAMGLPLNRCPIRYLTTGAYASLSIWTIYFVLMEREGNPRKYRDTQNGIPQRNEKLII